jgi:hypothetical protein
MTMDLMCRFGDAPDLLDLAFPVDRSLCGLVRRRRIIKGEKAADPTVFEEFA